MDTFTIVLIALGAIILIGLLIQFKLLSAKGIVFTLAAIGSIVGISLFVNARRKRLLAELQKREVELEEQEKKLKRLEEEYNISEAEVKEAQEAIQRDKVAYKKSILMIDAEKEKKVDAIEAMSPEEVLRAYAQAYGGK